MTRGHNDLLRSASRGLPPLAEAIRAKTQRDLARESAILEAKVVGVVLFVLAVYLIAGYLDHVGAV